MTKEMLDEWSNILIDWVNVCFTYDEVEKFLSFAFEHKEEMIKQLQGLEQWTII